MAITQPQQHKKISLEEAQNLIKSLVYASEGTFFTVQFIKRGNGELRTMNCRGGVKKGQTGEGLKFNPAEKNLIVVYDNNKLDQSFQNKKKLIDPNDKSTRGAYRMINLDSILTISAAGVLYTVK